LPVFEFSAIAGVELNLPFTFFVMVLEVIWKDGSASATDAINAKSKTHMARFILLNSLDVHLPVKNKDLDVTRATPTRGANVGGIVRFTQTPHRIIEGKLLSTMYACHTCKLRRHKQFGSANIAIRDALRIYMTTLAAHRPEL
jgi:hypothetical protein